MSERRTLRYWPWLVLCTAAGLVFGGLAVVFGAATLSTDSVGFKVFYALLTVGLAVLGGYALISLRVRTRIDESGATTVWPLSRRRLDWTAIDRLDVSHVLPGWAIRGWSQDRPVVIFICHDTHGRRPVPETFDTPPPMVPKALREGFVEIEQRWRSVEGGQPAQ